MRLRILRRGCGCLAQRAGGYALLNVIPVRSAALVTIVIATTHANAQSATDSTTTDTPSIDDALPYWAQGHTRPFVAGQAMAGLGVGRLTLSAGYGKPHFMWGGLEGNGSLTPYYANLQGGLHLSAFIADLYISYRRTYSLTHGLLPNASTVSDDDLDANSNNKVRYDALHAQMWGFIPYRRLLLAWEFACVRPFGQPSNTLLYEEIQRVIITPAGVFSIKATPMIKPSRSLKLYVGVLVEQLALLGRGVEWVWRLGPSAFVTLGDHWDVGGYLSWPIQSPDRLGFWNGMYGTAAIRYHFATGDG
jgi:hypothetical protein